MKKLLLLAALASSTFTMNAQDEKSTVFGLKAGLNLSSFSASINSDPGFRAGFHAGLYVRSLIGNNFYFRPELYFSSQGQKDNYGDSISTTTTVNFINVPMLFEVGRKVTFQFGPQLGLLLSAHEKGSGVDDDLKDIMRTIDFSGVIGIGVSPVDHFNFGLRYNLGFTDLIKGDEEAGVDVFPDVKNRVFHFYLAYSF